MTDATSNRLIATGTTAERNAFTPAPATPASGPDQGYLWYDTDDQTLYSWDFVTGPGWVAAGGGSGTVTSVAAGAGLVASPSPIVGAGTIASIVPPIPGGRLTLTSGVPVLSSSVTAATIVYYALMNSAWVPIWDGTQTVPTLITELSQATTDNTKSPAACEPYSVYDCFLWDDGGTPRCTRGPRWSKAATFTVTIASPAVFTSAGHGLKEGDVIYLTTTGALPTGLATGTPYFVAAAGLTADDFEVSATLSGAVINTSGAQSGVHTQTCYMIDRGTGAGTSQISRNTDGYYTNTVAITNGPGAGLGTYVGTIITDSASQVNMIFGGTGAAGGEGCVIGVWNAYNRVRMQMLNFDNTNSWTSATAGAYRLKNASAGNISSMVIGLQLEAVNGINSGIASNSNNSDRRLAWGLNSSLTAYVGAPIGYMPNQTANFGASGFITAVPGIGSQRLYPLESNAGGTATWLGDNGSTTLYTGSIVQLAA